MWEMIYESKSVEKYVIEELVKPSLIADERRKTDIKKLSHPWNCGLQNITLSFNNDQIEDKNGHIGKALQSLRQLLTSVFV